MWGYALRCVSCQLLCIFRITSCFAKSQNSCHSGIVPARSLSSRPRGGGAIVFSFHLPAIASSTVAITPPH